MFNQMNQMNQNDITGENLLGRTLTPPPALDDNDSPYPHITKLFDRKSIKAGLEDFPEDAQKVIYWYMENMMGYFLKLTENSNRHGVLPVDSSGTVFLEEADHVSDMYSAQPNIFMRQRNGANRFNRNMNHQAYAGTGPIQPNGSFYNVPDLSPRNPFVTSVLDYTNHSFDKAVYGNQNRSNEFNVSKKTASLSRNFDGMGLRSLLPDHMAEKLKATIISCKEREKHLTAGFPSPQAPIEQQWFIDLSERFSEALTKHLQAGNQKLHPNLMNWLAVFGYTFGKLIQSSLYPSEYNSQDSLLGRIPTLIKELNIVKDGGYNVEIILDSGTPLKITVTPRLINISLIDEDNPRSHNVVLNCLYLINGVVAHNNNYGIPSQSNRTASIIFNEFLDEYMFIERTNSSIAGFDLYESIFRTAAKEIDVILRHFLKGKKDPIEQSEEDKDDSIISIVSESIELLK